jgi:hypothetical protein
VRAEEAPPIPRDFWRILTRAHAPWVVKGPPGKITVETYARRQIDGADVARLRWTFRPVDATRPKEVLAADQCRFTHVAVTDAGLYLLPEDADDAAIRAALKRRPSRSSPLRPYPPTRRNEGRMLEIKDGLVCWGWVNPTDQDCDDTCEGTVCAAPGVGVVYLDGTCAPDFEIFGEMAR